MKIFNRNKKELTSLNDNKEKNTDNSILEDVALNEQEDLEKNSKFVYLPTNFVVGYYEGMTQKGLKEYINGYVFKYFDTPNITNYRMIKYDAGYIFEIHDGDSETSYLKQIISEFNKGESTVIIKIQNRIAKVTKNFNKVTTYLLPENENDKHPTALLPEKGKMKPIQSTGFGFISFGLALAVLGITSLFLSSLFKTVLSKNETFKVNKQIIESPSIYIERLPVAVETSYISKVWFENNKWDKKETKIKTVEMENLEKNNMFISKVSSYTKFVERCASKTSLNNCNDDNPFLDKINIMPNDNISSINLKNGIIELKIKETKDYIKFIPDFNEDKIVWTYECSKIKLANICMSPNVKITGIEDVSKKEILVENLVKNEKIIKEDNKISIKEKMETVKENIIKIEKIVENPINEIQNINIGEIKNNTPTPTIPDLPKNLDLSEIPENIIIE